MIITPESIKSIRSFKLGYSRSLPSYLLPKLLTNKRAEEYFITSIFAQQLFYDGTAVIGINLCDDDSDKGPDSIIKILNKEPLTIQVTRFLLTEYLGRVSRANKEVDKLISEILKAAKIKFEFPINVSINLKDDSQLPKNNEKIRKRLAEFIVEAILKNKEVLKSSDQQTYWELPDEKLRESIPVISLQRIPQGFYSAYFGRDNIFIDYDFDKVRFSKEDLENESITIYNKKNGGKAKVLLIWADMFEILYDFPGVAKSLNNHFISTSFEQVLFYCFYNNHDLYFNQKVHVAKIK